MAVLVGSGLQIAALDMYQDNVNSRAPYIKRIYASHAQVVCLALSLFLLHTSMHDVVITCNMRNAESSILRLLLQACLGQYRDTLTRTLSTHMCHRGSDRSAKKRKN